MKHIQRFADGTTLAFGRGMFDEWCVLVTNARVSRYAPRDEQYFTRLVQLGQLHGETYLYNDFVRVYRQTDAQLRITVLNDICVMAETYAPNIAKVELILTLLYATMVAEENKRKAILKKRIKRLAVHQLLIEHMPVADVAQWSRGKTWRVLDAACRERGF